MAYLADCCMGVTITHPLPPLKRGGLSGKAQFLKTPTAISKSFASLFNRIE
jgi:hypothetical protein